MKSMHRLAAVAILVIAALCATQVRAQPVLQGNVIEFGSGVEVVAGANATAGRPLLRFAAGSALQPGPSLMEIGTDGSVEFFNNATVDFAGFVTDQVVPTALRGWIAVRVAGAYVIIPAYGFAAIRQDRQP